ncbi:MAG: metal-dependent hydrolase [Candidatus Diapherotrites archaeon]|uniref:Metal-dependent hydrolase n=1 Tax=Candidatus Iainarchaeum sp. TaxID=3101447 RepID=A0A2D6M0D4_9ARCH|nr:metal-dependent hydrolase [Candidatus Diapherotrites archaeon]
MVDIQYFGHSFFRVGFPDRNILIDPFINSTNNTVDFKRLIQCGAKKKDLCNIAMILVTHEHFDHFDKATIEDIVAKENCCVVAHDHILSELDVPIRFKAPIRMDQSLCLRNINIKALSAHHPNAFYPVGFLLEFENQRVFHAGDTALTNSFNEIKTDIAMLPIGGTYTMDCVDAVRAVKTMKPKYVIPMHFGTFSMIEQDPKEFKQRIEKSVLKTKAVVLKPGQKIKIKL